MYNYIFKLLFECILMRAFPIQDKFQSYIPQKLPPFPDLCIDEKMHITFLNVNIDPPPSMGTCIAKTLK